MTPEEAKVFAERKEEALSWVRVGAADLAADIVSMIKSNAGNDEILKRCHRALEGATVHSCDSSDITP